LVIITIDVQKNKLFLIFEIKRGSINQIKKIGFIKLPTAFVPDLSPVLRMERQAFFLIEVLKIEVLKNVNI
jgi:hypothetical protein